MAELTSKFLLEKPTQDNYYDIEVYNRNMDKLDANAVKSSGVAEIRVLSQVTYNIITPVENVLYLTDIGAMYLGNVRMNAGGSLSASSLTPDYTGTEGAAGVLEMEES